MSKRHLKWFFSATPKKTFPHGLSFKTWGSTKNPPFFLLKNYGEITAEAQRPEAHGQTSRDLMAYCDTCLVLRKVSRCLSRMREHISVKFEGGMRAVPGATILPKVSHRITYLITTRSIRASIPSGRANGASRASGAGALAPCIPIGARTC